MTTRKLAPVLLGLAAAAALSGCGPSEGVWPEKEGPRVVVTLPVLSDFVRKVAGDRGTVHCLCEGQGYESADYVPTREDAALLRRANVLFANGLGIDDDWTSRLRANAPNPDLKYVALGEPIARPEGVPDAHVWMDVNDAVEMVKKVRDTLTEIDRAGAAEYEANAQKYIGDLNDLLKDKDAVELAGKSGALVGVGQPLERFLANFGRKLRPVAEVETGADGRPTPRGYDRLAEFLATGKADLAAVRSEDVLNALADELKKRGATDLKPPYAVVIDPLTSADAPNGPHGYLERMKENFHRLNAAVK